MEKKSVWTVRMALPGADEDRWPNGAIRLVNRVFDAKSGDLFRITATPEEVEEMLASNGWAVRGLIWESDDVARFEGAAIHSRFDVWREG